jgi:hypothetical protein
MTSYLQERLPPILNADPSMWVDEAIWGHRYHDEQTPWLTFLEFLNVFTHESARQRGLIEVGGYNTLRYKAARRLELRNILFNNPRMMEVRSLPVADDHKWRRWAELMGHAVHVADPGFAYLRRHFQTFDDFADIVGMVQATSLEVDTNKRWTSKFAFPYGRDCLFEDLNKEAVTNDRNFFGRTGEILYLMLCRSKNKDTVRERLLKYVDGGDGAWNRVLRALQPPGDAETGSELARCYLPYPEHPSFDRLGEDWAAVLGLELPGYDALPHLVGLAGLHLIIYQLTVARDIARLGGVHRMVCEVVAPKKTLIRDLAADAYQENNLLPAQAVDQYLKDIEESEEWATANAKPEAFVECRGLLERMVLWGSDYNGTPEPTALMATLKEDAKKRHKQHVANVHRNYGRSIGLVSKRGTNKLRYAPSDELLKSLILANVGRRMESSEFLAVLYARYGMVFGEREAGMALAADEFEVKPFKANAKRLEQRLGSLGLIKRLSDGCAYILNPYSRGEP